MNFFRQIDCLSMAYGLCAMAVIATARSECWQQLPMMVIVAIIIRLALIQRERKGGDNGE